MDTLSCIDTVLHICNAIEFSIFLRDYAARWQYSLFLLGRIVLNKAFI